MNDVDGGLTQSPAGKGKPPKTGVSLKGSLTVVRKLSKTEVLYYLWFFYPQHFYLDISFKTQILVISSF